MTFANVFDWLMVAMLAFCVAVWPVKRISNAHKRWLTIIAVGLCALHLIVDGPRVQLLPAYPVAVILIARLVLSSMRSRDVSPRETLKRRLARWIVVVATGSTLLVCALLCLVFPRHEYPVPSGRYGVGVHDFRLTDASRLETDTPDPKDHREVLVRASYPAAIDPNASYERVTVPDRAIIAVRYAVMFLWPGYDSAGLASTSWGRIRTNGWNDAPVAVEPTRFPVLIYSHGLGSWPEQNTVLIEELVSHGYIVLVLNHAGLSAGFERSDGSMIGLEPHLERARAVRAADNGDSHRAQPSTPAIDLTDASVPVDVRLRVLEERAALRPRAAELISAAHRRISDDQRFVAASTETLQMNDVVLGGHIDLERIGFLGMSAGGTASHITCTVDPHCRAGLNMDGFTSVLLEIPPLTVPFMHMSNARFHNHRIPHEQSTAASYLVRVAGSAHGSFTDAVLTTPSLQQLGRIGIDVTGTIDGRRMLEVMNTYVLAFFDKHLKEEAQPLLDRSSERFPEVDFQVRASQSVRQQ